MLELKLSGRRPGGRPNRKFLNQIKEVKRVVEVSEESSGCHPEKSSDAEIYQKVMIPYCIFTMT